MVPAWTHAGAGFWAFTVTRAVSECRDMFVRPVWRPQSPEEAFQIIDENLWALLVNNGENGPLVTNLPLLLDRTRGKHGTLLGHIARANEHAAALFDSKAPTLA